ncbi:RxLR-like protein [Plasmopara halstedii]|uniref:RxLR-like protein n=1 Tax=Plasmopara halstedii TaxID=4781 RepID=A0A0P1ABH7_PLAHL|nr:RxLR-like protein [Plasmopara halstedii]CEG38206.1 RxLR-like protein [Plasmopara halstedii]|eukprot:XP_024574575.1 RxLR-like protein [Plasmopara halstedii]
MAKRDLSTHFCLVLLSSVVLLALRIDSFGADATYLNANLRQDTRTLTPTTHEDLTNHEPRTMTAAAVVHGNLFTHLLNRIWSWVLQNIGSSSVIRRVSPIGHMKLTSDKKEAAFNLLKDFNVDKVEIPIFESQAFVKWSSVFSKAFPNDQDLRAELMVSALVRHDEAKLIESIAQVKPFSGSTLIAKQLEKALIEKWLGDSSEKMIDVLKKPMLQKWFRTLPKRDPARETLFFKAYERNGFETEATDFQEAAQTTGGIFSEMAKSILGIKLSNDLFHELKLDEATSSKDIVDHGSLDTWLMKVEELEWDPVKLLFPKLRAVSTDIDILVDCVSKNHLPVELRDKLQDAVLDEWVGTSGSAALKYLGLDVVNNGPFYPLLLSWASYMRRLFPETASIEMVKVLRSFFPNKLGEKIAQAKESDNRPLQALAEELAAAAIKLDDTDNLPQPDLPPPVAPMPDV